MITIELTKLIFNARHGFYEEEKILGGTFEVNAVIRHSSVEMPVKHITDTIDYTAVYDIIRQTMEKPTALLETLASGIAREILTNFSQAEEVSINIKKINPPIIAFQGTVGVTCVLNRSDLQPGPNS
ncbi:MAG TPA: dihydroneopterin aldolase [Chitinophagaceae bacterium]|nr:dihydroneopterin aldolase [Chitinophagaceae bacterium]